MATLIVRVKRFFTSKETTRGWVLVGGALLLLLGTLADWWLFAETRAYRQEEVQQKLIARNIQDIRSYSIDFQTLGAAYVAAVLDDRENINEHLEELRENVVTQYAAFDVYAGMLDETTLVALERYRQELQEMGDELAGGHSVLSLRSFWEAASGLLVARNEVIRELDRQEKATQGQSLNRAALSAGHATGMARDGLP